MGVTVKLVGVPPSVAVKDLADNLNKMLDNPDIGTFRVRELDPVICNSKRLIALDFRSGYDAMYAQDSLHGKEYTLPDRTIVILQAKVTKDRKYMPDDSFDPLVTTLPSKVLRHPVDEPSSSILPIDNDLPKDKKKSDKKIKSKLKKIEKKEYELLMVKARLQKELNELVTPTFRNGAVEVPNHLELLGVTLSSNLNFGSYIEHMAKMAAKKLGVLGKVRRYLLLDSFNLELFQSRVNRYLLGKHVPSWTAWKVMFHQSDSEDVPPPKKRRASKVGSKKSSLVDHFSDSTSSRRSSSRDPRANISRSQKDSTPTDSDSEDVRPKKRRDTQTPDVETKRISSADHFSNKLLRKKYSYVMDSPTLDSRRSSSRDLTLSLSRDARDSLSCDPRRRLSHDARDSSSCDPRRRLSRDARDSLSCDLRRSLSREAKRAMSRNPRDGLYDPKESLYQEWRDSPRDARQILNRELRHSTSRELRESVSSDRKRKLSSFDERRSSYLDLRHSLSRDPRDSMTREFRDESYYDSKDNYSRELRVKKKKLTSRELSITKSPLERSSTDRQISSRSKTVYESAEEKVPKTRKTPLDAETKVKVEGVKIKSEASDSNVGINIRDEAIKDILLETEKLFNELCAKHTVSDADKKMVLKNLFDVINKRMKGLKITSEMGVSCVIMHYRCKYSKVEDNAFLTELFENLASSRNENEPQPETESPASPAADNIWNIVDAVLLEFELETLEDIKPKIEPPEEEPQTVTITVSSDKDNTKTQYTIQDAVNGYYINIIMDKNRLKKFYITIDILLKQMKIHIEKYTNYVYFELLQYVLRGILEKRIAKVLVGKEYMKAKAVWSLYRNKYTLEQDGPFVLQTVYDIWGGKYNDEYVAYETNTAVTDANSNETEKNKETNETPLETPVVFKTEKDNKVTEISQETQVKTEKDKVNEISKETPDVITKDKDTNEIPNETTKVKTEKDMEVNEISEETPKLIAKDKEVTETTKESPQVNPEKDKVNDVISKIIPAVKMETDEEVSVINADKTVNVKIEQTNKENDVQSKSGSKEVDKINTLNNDMIKSEKADTVNTATTDCSVTSNLTAKETAKAQELDNGDDDDDVIFVEDTDVVKDVSNTIKTETNKPSKDDDVLVVESKIEVIDLSDADDTRNAKAKTEDGAKSNMEKPDQNVIDVPADDDVLDINVSGEIDTPGDTHKKNVTTEALATMATNKATIPAKASPENLQSSKIVNKTSNDDVIICLSDNENDVIEVVDCETLDSKIKSEAVNTHRLEDAERVKEERTVPAENHNVDDEVNIIDDNDDDASVDTLILIEEHLDLSEDNHTEELNESDIPDQNTSESANDFKIATVHVEVTKIRPEEKNNNSDIENVCNHTVLSNTLGKVTGVIESSEERNSSLFAEDAEESIQSIQNFLQKTSHDS